MKRILARTTAFILAILAKHAKYSKHCRRFLSRSITVEGIERDPKIKSRWVAIARSRKKIMQFIRDGSYVAVAADGRIIMYRKAGAT